MKQKIIKIGTSIGIVIPKAIAQEKGFHVGGTATLTLSDDSNRIIIEPTPWASSSGGVVQAVMRATAYIERYRKDFEALADK